MEQDNNQSTTPNIKKSKGPVVCSALCIILALAGIGFGVYGMFFNKTNAPAKTDDNTSTVTKEAPSRETIAKLLKEKYDLDEFNGDNCGGTVLSAGVFANSGELDDTTKISLILKKDYFNFDSIEFNDCNGYCAYSTISYAELNEKAHKLFGNSSDLAKDGYGTPYIMGVDSVEYLAETDSFKVKYVTGFGCVAEPEGYYVNVADVKSTDAGFTATVSTLRFDATEAKVDGWRECGDIAECPHIMMNTIKTSNAVYDFDFIEEDGVYKLVKTIKK